MCPSTRGSHHVLPRHEEQAASRCRPIKQANGMQEFNEVYFTDVVIPDSQRLGRSRRRLERRR